MKKTVFYTEIAYLIALALLAFGTALTVYGNLGVSMVVAPAFVLHLFVSKFLPFFSFAFAEYILQLLVMLILILILRKVRRIFLLSFLAAIVYGIALDLSTILISMLPNNIFLQIVLYIIGTIICCAAIALLFTSYLPPKAYDLFCKETAIKYNLPVHKIVNSYNIASLSIAILLSIIFFGNIQGIGVGTVVCAFIYGRGIYFFQNLYRKLFYFADIFPFRKYFE